MQTDEENFKPRWGGLDSSLSLVGEGHAAGAITPEEIQTYIIEKHSTVLDKKTIGKMLKAAAKEGAEFEAYCVALARQRQTG